MASAISLLNLVSSLYVGRNADKLDDAHLSHNCDLQKILTQNVIRHSVLCRMSAPHDKSKMKLCAFDGTK